MPRRYRTMQTIARRTAFRREHRMSEQRLTLAAPGAPVVTGEEMQIIRTTIAKDATPAELALFLYDCARQHVHPLDRLIHFTKRKDKYTPITSIDFLRTRAMESGDCAGIADPLFEGTPKSPSFTATVTVHRLVQGQRCAFTATARWSEYKPEQAFMWDKMPHTMLGKCAEALALRKGFPKQLAGLYVTEEMEQAAPIPPRPVPPGGMPLPIPEPVSESTPGAAADLTAPFPDSWKAFATDVPITGVITAGRRSTSGTRTTITIGGVDYYTLDPAIAMRMMAHKAAGEPVTITVKDTTRGKEILTLAVADDLQQP